MTYKSPTYWRDELGHIVKVNFRGRYAEIISLNHNDNDPFHALSTSATWVMGNFKQLTEDDPELPLLLLADLP